MGDFTPIISDSTALGQLVENLGVVTELSSPGKRPWGPEQVTGAPDTSGFGDIQTAWASQSQDDQDEWLLLDYGEMITPASIVIHETYNPGAVSRIAFIPFNSPEAVMWTGSDPTAPGQQGGVSKITFERSLATQKVKIYLDSKRVPGWNEIDAVGLVDHVGVTHWAVTAEASSTYAERGASSGASSPITVIEGDSMQDLINEIRLLREEIQKLRLTLEINSSDPLKRLRASQEVKAATGSMVESASGSKP